MTLPNRGVSRQAEKRRFSQFLGDKLLVLLVYFRWISCGEVGNASCFRALEGDHAVAEKRAGVRVIHRVEEPGSNAAITQVVAVSLRLRSEG